MRGFPLNPLSASKMKHAYARFSAYEGSCSLRLCNWYTGWCRNQPADRAWFQLWHSWSFSYGIYFMRWWSSLLGIAFLRHNFFNFCTILNLLMMVCDGMFVAFRHVKQGNCNLMTVDWSCSHGSHTCDLPTDYYETVGRIDFIGHRVGQILAWMHNVLALNGSSTEFYAHSLGCHISGGAARRFRELLGTNISVIVGEHSFFVFFTILFVQAQQSLCLQGNLQ